MILSDFGRIVNQVIGTSGALISVGADQYIAWSSHDRYAIVVAGHAQAERLEWYVQHMLLIERYIRRAMVQAHQSVRFR